MTHWLCLGSDEDDCIEYVRTHPAAGGSVWHLAWPPRLDRLLRCPVFDRLVVTDAMFALRESNPEWYDSLLAEVRKRVRSQVSA